VNPRLLKDSFALLAPRAAELAEYFYAQLFYRGGQEVSDMFPPLMSGQRDRLLGALTRIVTDVEDLEKLGEYLAGLGRDHRKFAVRPEHYDLVGQSLLATLEHFAGEAWTPELKAAWAGAYALIAKVMQAGADSDDGLPPWWDAIVVSREMRAPDIAVIDVRVKQPLDYEAGQSLAVQFPKHVPRVWRFYSPANRPDGSGRLTFHVKAEDGGLLSTALAVRADPGDELKLGPPVGNLKLDRGSGRDVLLVAGSTGLAPLMAILEEISCGSAPPAVHLFFGARTPEDLYALPALEKLTGEHDWLTLTHAVSAAAPGYEGKQGNIVDIMAREGRWQDRDAYACGSTPMTRAAASRLAAIGVPPEHVHVEDFGWEN
jgi:NAD(P)H-flavin reductase/hemoglobin-like flavoprotein